MLRLIKIMVIGAMLAGGWPGLGWADSISPQVTMDPPSGGVTALPAAGFWVEGSARDEIPACLNWHNSPSGVKAVRMRVYDTGRGAFSVKDQFAEYNPADFRWSYQVRRRDVTDGRPALVGAQAEDHFGNRGDWVYRKIQIGTIFEEPVLNAPSVVSVEGPSLKVSKPEASGVPGPAENFTIRGVTWQPATRAPDCGPLPENPLARVPYGFFHDGNWRLPGPQGHELMRDWIRSEFADKAALDIALMKELGINTVRTFIDWGTDPAVFRPVLDEFSRHGIMVIVTVAQTVGDLRDKAFVPVVEVYRDHPAILMWSLGNEWNWGEESLYGIDDGQFDSSDGWLEVLGPAAAEIRRLDPHHPVTTAIIETWSMTEIQRDCIDQCGIDVWGLNVYRAGGFAEIFEEWTELTGGLPFYFSEFGTDAFRVDSYQPVGPGPNGICASSSQGCAVNVTGAVDEDKQAEFNVGRWTEIADQLAVDGGNCLGGIIHSFNDQLYLVGNYHLGLGGIIAYDGADARPFTPDDDTSYDASNSEGFQIVGGHPDSVANEEYFGQVDAERTPRVSYRRFQEQWAPQSVEPALTHPILGVPLTSSSLLLQWRPGVGAEEYFLGVGTRPQAVSRYPWGDVFAGNVGLELSHEISGLPLNGQPLYVRLWWRKNGQWGFKDSEFDRINAPMFLFPQAGIAVKTSTVTFQWTPVAGAGEYYLGVGTTPLASGDIWGGNLFSFSTGSQTFQAVSGIPLNGQPLYVRLGWRVNNDWQFADDQFDTALVVSPELTHPSTDDPITESAMTFEWSAGGGVGEYYLGVGTTARAVSRYPWGDVWAGSTGLSTAKTVFGIPLNDQPLYARLWWKVNGDWNFRDYEFQAGEPLPPVVVPPEITSPVVGKVIDAETVRFAWSAGTGVEGYYLGVGTTAGAVSRYPWGDLFSGDVGAALSWEVTGIPLNGQPIYVRLWWSADGEWNFMDYSYSTVDASESSINHVSLER